MVASEVKEEDFNLTVSYCSYLFEYKFFFVCQTTKYCCVLVIQGQGICIVQRIITEDVNVYDFFKMLNCEVHAQF